jgi:aminoglycoside phosphotransferase (APT) family kinase protein
MCARKMHAHELDIDASLVRRLLAAQFPDWAELPIERVESAGTDNAIYRLGKDMAARLPRVHEAIAQVEKEHRWLPRLAPHLPLAIPVPLAKGTPAEGYPWHWSVYRWLKGENATIEQIADLHQAAIELARFVTAMQRIDPAGGPHPGEHNFFRGMPLATRDARTRAAIASLRGSLDSDALIAAWEAALWAPAWKGQGAWIHGDLHAGNLLVERGRLSAVIDFGGLGVGDPACDVMVAWTFLSTETRDVFRAGLPVDDATWARGRGWALSFGVVALEHYLNINPGLSDISRRAIEEVLADRKPDLSS